jgi:hypothetical protein
VKNCPTFTALHAQLVTDDEVKNVVCLEGITKPTVSDDFICLLLVLTRCK